MKKRHASPRRKTQPPKAALVTLGCPTNQVDSEHIMSGLVSLGFEIVPEEEAEIIIVNTCGFIEAAREESIETIMSVAELKENGRLKSLVVAGCLAERYRTELEEEMNEADAVVGLADRASIPRLCLELLGRNGDIEPVYSRVVSGPPHTAYLRIAEGCDNRCSYCAIPMIRGPFASVPMETVLADAEELASLGIRELVLVAQDTTNYGADLNGPTLARLLEKLSDIEDVSWIRLLYANPAKFTDSLIEAMVTLPKVLPYADIPIQHISPSVLKRMGRPADAGVIRSLVERLRSRIEGIALRTTVMVGFPGETDKDFDELMDFLDDTRFERLGVFGYSPEEGTRAYDFENSIPDDVVNERLAAVMELQSQIASEFHKSLVGRTFEMIVDDPDGPEGKFIGRTCLDAPEIDGNVIAAGSVQQDTPFVTVRITDASPYDLYGEIVEGHSAQDTPHHQ